MSLSSKSARGAGVDRTPGDHHNTQEKHVHDNGPSDKQNIDSATGDMLDANLVALDGTIVNASGHKDQLQRHYGFFSICGLALSVDNAWVAIGTSLNVAICK